MERGIVFASISTGLYIGGVIPYWKDVLRGRTLPHPFSQLVWTIAFFISTSILIYNLELIGSIPGIVSTIANAIWCFYGFRSYKKIPINWFDTLCLVLAILTLIYGVITRRFFDTIILIILVDFLAFLPTLKKGWILPWSDTIITWLLAGIQYIFLLLALGSMTFENIGFWSYNIIATIFFFFMVFFRRWYLKGWKSIFE